MRKKIVHNPTNSDIVDYNIAEASLNSNGEIIWNTMTGTYETTKQTLQWTIRAGETLEFPAYVADYLKKIYDFLEVMDNVEVKSEVPEVQPIEAVSSARPREGSLACKYCGKIFANKRAYGLHIGAKHTDKIL